MLNKATLIGFLGGDPTIRYTASGNAVANFTVATSEKFTDKDGKKTEKTEWHRITAFQKIAELVTTYLKKGSLVYLEGKLQTRTWEDKEGKKRETTEILVNHVQFLDRKGEEKAGEKAAEVDDSEIPF